MVLDVARTVKDQVDLLNQRVFEENGGISALRTITLSERL